MKTSTCSNCSSILLTLTLVACTRDGADLGHDHAEVTPSESVQIAGNGIHYMSTSILHSETQTATGVTRRSSEVVKLAGDVVGYVLYHPKTEIDATTNKLVNTGRQYFSGTIHGGPPVLLHDETFRFDVDLATGATKGRVQLRRSNDSRDDRWYECDLDVTGTGMSPAGDALFDYTGECRVYTAPAAGR